MDVHCCILGKALGHHQDIAGMFDIHQMARPYHAHMTYVCLLIVCYFPHCQIDTRWMLLPAVRVYLSTRPLYISLYYLI